VNEMSCYTEELLDAACSQIQRDVEMEDMTSIYELLNNIEAKYLEGYLTEEELSQLKTKWNMIKSY